MTKKPTPFTHVSDIYKRGAVFRGNDGYAQYIINKELSKNGDVISLVNHAQQFKLSNEHHFKVMNSMYPHSRRPGFKEFPWIWKKASGNDEEIEVIAKYYDESIANATDYHKILLQSKDGKKHIKWLMDIHGKSNV